MNESNHRTWFAIGAVVLALGIALGAFGAHALQGRLEPRMLDVYQKAVFYQLIHGMGILLIVIASNQALIPQRLAILALRLFLFGVIAFSGSLYLLAITNVHLLGIITPFGGVSFIIGWLMLARAAFAPKQ